MLLFCVCVGNQVLSEEEAGENCIVIKPGDSFV